MSTTLFLWLALLLLFISHRTAALYVQHMLADYLIKSDAKAKVEALVMSLGLQHSALNLELANATTELILANLADTKAQLTAFHMSNCKMVTISFSNLAYSNVFTNWYTMVGSNCSAIIALDDDTCAYLTARKAHFRSWCMVTPPSILAKFKSNTAIFDQDFKNNYLLGMAKLLFPGIFVFLGKHIIFTDMDLFWQTENVVDDLLSTTNKVYDVQIASHILYNYQHQQFTLGRGEVNIGFFFFRHTPRTLVFFKELLLYTIFHTVELGFYWTWDQKLYDRLIRSSLPPGDDLPQWDSRFKDFKEFSAILSKGQNGILWRRLPSTYTTNIGRRGSKLQFHPKTATVHISFGIKEPTNRMYCAHRLGLIAPNSSYLPSSSRQFCFELFDANGTFYKRID
jgi:hypothetical protein